MQQCLPIAMTNDWQSFWTEANQSSRIGLIAEFTNIPGAVGQEAVNAAGVVAHIVYTGVSGVQLRISGCWLDWAIQATHFRPGTTRKLVMGVIEQNGDIVVVENCRDKIPEVNSFMSKAPHLEPIARRKIDGMLPCIAKVVLIDERNRTLVQRDFTLRKQGDGVILV